MIGFPSKRVCTHPVGMKISLGRLCDLLLTTASSIAVRSQNQTEKWHRRKSDAQDRHRGSRQAAIRKGRIAELSFVLPGDVECCPFGRRHGSTTSGRNQLPRCCGDCGASGPVFRSAWISSATVSTIRDQPSRATRSTSARTFVFERVDRHARRLHRLSTFDRPSLRLRDFAPPPTDPARPVCASRRCHAHDRTSPLLSPADRSAPHVSPSSGARIGRGGRGRRPEHHDVSR